MPVFENLRNFIRHGKQAQEEKKPRTSLHASRQGSLQGDPVASGTASPVLDAAKQLVLEDYENARRMPSYKGLEGYLLLDKMGDGAFSIVYKARELETGNDVAIKVVIKNGLSNSQKASVLKEAAIMRQLHHPNIVEMKAFRETAEHYFIILELVPGGELFHQIVRLTYFSEDLSRHVIVQVAHAIRYLHEEAGVVHRDIKPENLLFAPVAFVPSKQRVFRDGDDESKQDEGEFVSGIGGGGIGEIKLADFGLSKVIWDSKTMTPCGTVGYTAPEIVKDEKYSKNVDMWALGCVLYTMLCGFPPFYDESIDVLTRKVAKGQYTFLSPWWDDISDSAKELVSQLLTVDPKKRLTIDEFLAHPWISGGIPPKVPSKDPAHIRRADPARGDAIRDAFDVSNAVYRMEEDTRRGGAEPAIIEEDEEEELPPISELKLDTREKERAAAARHAERHAPSTTFFDLKIEGATLLERRRKNALAA